MWNMIWPIATVVIANIIYNICAKSMPSDANSFLSLTVCYIIAAAVSAGIYFLGGDRSSVLADLKNLNWTSLAMGIAIIGLEFGYICIYRAGWKVGLGSLVANICLACVLLIVGIVLYKENISPRQIAGIAVCVLGLVLIGK